MKIFEGVAKPVSWFVVPLFLIRVGYGQLSGDSSEIRAAIKGVILYFVLIVSFGVILDVLLELPQSFIPEISSHNMADKTEALTKQEIGNFFTTWKSIPETLAILMEYILAIIYWAVLVLHLLVMILMTSMAPIVFLLSCVLNVGVSVRIFFGLMIVSSCWPVMWYGFDQALLVMDKVVPDTFGKLVLELVVTLIKGIGSASLAYMSLNSGPGKAIVSSASKGFSAGASSLLSQSKNTKSQQGFSQNTGVSAKKQSPSRTNKPNYNNSENRSDHKDTPETSFQKFSSGLKEHGLFNRNLKRAGGSSQASMVNANNGSGTVSTKSFTQSSGFFNNSVLAGNSSAENIFSGSSSTSESFVAPSESPLSRQGFTQQTGGFAQANANYSEYSNSGYSDSQPAEIGSLTKLTGTTRTTQSRALSTPQSQSLNHSFQNLNPSSDLNTAFNNSTSSNFNAHPTPQTRSHQARSRIISETFNQNTQG